jgi:prepilin-type N-terminal cleavage/methylation domain-containing protein
MMKRFFLKKEGGFTLIELIVVITLIGIVVAALVGILGNPLRDASVDGATSKIADHLRSISGGADHFFSRTTVEVTTMAELTTGANATLRMSPVPPPFARSAARTGAYGYSLDTTTYTQWRTPATDTVAVLAGLTDAVCRRLNEQFAGNATIFTAVQPDRDIQCIRPTGATYATALKVIHSR